MNRRESNKISMYLAVEAVFDNHRESIDSSDQLAESVKRYRTSLAEIQKCDLEYTDTTAGVTAAKRHAEETMVEKTMYVAKAINALGVKTGNEPLKAESRMSRSRLAAIRDNNQVQFCMRITALAEEHAGELASYGINAEDIEGLRAAAEGVKSAVAEQVRKTAEIKTARKQLSEAFVAADTILKSELDPLIELVKVKDNELCDQYRAVRVIKDLGGSHTSKNGKTEAASFEAAPEPEPAMEQTMA